MFFPLRVLVSPSFPALARLARSLLYSLPSTHLRGASKFLLTGPMAEDDQPQPLSPTSSIPNNIDSPPGSLSPTSKTKPRRKDKDKEAAASAKRRCVSTACIACRRRKSKVCLLPSPREPCPNLKPILTSNVMV